LSAWYNNLGSLALAREWQASHGEAELPACAEWVVRSLAVSPLDRALALDPHNERALLNAGRVAWLTGDCETAVSIWSSLSSSDTIARLEAANALYALGREKEALALYRQIEGGAAYLQIRGEVAEDSQATDAALTWYELAIKVLPGVATAQSLSTLYVESGQPDAAMAAWDRVVQATAEDDPDHWWALGQSAELAEDWRLAASAYGRGADQSDAPCSFYQRQAASLEQLEEWDKAESVCWRALAVCSDLMWPYLRLGHLCRRQADYARALHWYRQAEILWPENIYPTYYIGISYYEQEDYDRAKTYFQRALVSVPRHLGSTYYLAWSLYQLGEKQSAVEMLSRAIDLHPRQPWDWAVWLGDWYLELGDPQKALSAYQQALEWNPRDENIQARIETVLKSVP